MPQFSAIDMRCEKRELHSVKEHLSFRASGMTEHV